MNTTSREGARSVMTEVLVRQQSIADADADVLVNASNTMLRLGRVGRDSRIV
jgi:hypothetical protein